MTRLAHVRPHDDCPELDVDVTYAVLHPAIRSISYWCPGCDGRRFQRLPDAEYQQVAVAMATDAEDWARYQRWVNDLPGVEDDDPRSAFGPALIAAVIGGCVFLAAFLHFS
jgi:hypothetical protein